MDKVLNVDIQTFKIFFHVLHQSDEIPQSVDFYRLRGLAFIADQYDCARALLPWAIKWISVLSVDPGHNTDILGYEDWLFIGSVFKVEECHSLMGRVTATLMNHLTGSNEGNTLIFVNHPASGVSEIRTNLIPKPFIGKTTQIIEKAFEFAELT